MSKKQQKKTLSKKDKAVIREVCASLAKDGQLEKLPETAKALIRVFRRI